MKYENSRGENSIQSGEREIQMKRKIISAATKLMSDCQFHAADMFIIRKSQLRSVRGAIHISLLRREQPLSTADYVQVHASPHCVDGTRTKRDEIRKYALFILSFV